MLPTHWPHWIIIPIGLTLAIASIGMALVLEPAVQSLYQHPEPTPTVPCLDYAAPLSGECISCHTEPQTVQALVASESEAQRLLIEPSALESVHGRLGCVTCHGGTSGTDDVDAAHTGLVLDPSTRYEYTCATCHRDLRALTSGELFHEPHPEVLDEVTCSECHGAVGHGFSTGDGRTVCSMGACLDCHEEQDLDVQLRDCGSCHVGPHDVAAALSCSDCHTSISNWNETRLSVHPIELTGGHAEAECFDCHRWPNFVGLSYICSDCHEQPHEFGASDCASCHNGGGDTTTAGGHRFPIQHGDADGDCGACHPSGDTSAYYCFTCHSPSTTVSFHSARGLWDILSKCTHCHLTDVEAPQND